VVYRGQLLPRSTLDQMLAHAEAFAGRKPIGDVLFSTIQQQGADTAVVPRERLPDRSIVISFGGPQAQEYSG
jgi:hypothetical protein